MTGQWFANPVAGEATDVPAYFAFNQASELTIVDDRLKGLGVSYYDRDVMGRVVKKVTAAGAVYYEFDLSGKRVSLKDPGLAKNYYVFDAAGRLIRQLLDTRPVYFAYDKSGLITRRLLPGGVGTPHRVMSYLFYDAAGRTLRIENRGSAYATVINYFHYQRNENALPTLVRREEDKVTYLGYDELDRVVFEHQKWGAFNELCDYYSYDLASNRLSKLNTVEGWQEDYSYDDRNLLTQVARTGGDGRVSEFDFDDSQRLVRRLSSSDPPRSSYFQFDQLNRLNRLEALPHGGTNVCTFRYTAMGERVESQELVGEPPVYFSYDGGMLLSRGGAGGAGIVPRYRHAPPSGVLPSLVSFEATGFSDQYTAGAGKTVWKQAQSGGAAVGYFAYDAFLRTQYQVQGAGQAPNTQVGQDPGGGWYRAPTFGEITFLTKRGV